MNRSYLTLKYEVADEAPAAASVYNTDSAPVNELEDNQLTITYEVNHTVEGLNNLRSAAQSFPYPASMIIEGELKDQIEELTNEVS